MNLFGRTVAGKLKQLFFPPELEPAEQASRIVRIERDIILPVKTILIVTLVYYFFFSRWLDQASSTREVAFETIRGMFLVYIAVNVVTAGVLIAMRHLPLRVLQWILFTMGLLDGLLIAALTLVTGGFDSIIYWVFLGLILRNAVSLPAATLQLVVNFAVCFFYIVAGLIDVSISAEEAEAFLYDPNTRRALDLGYEENPAEPFLLRTIVLFLWAVCCYGIQALFERHQQALEDAKEFAVREEQLQTAGRLAAEIAHQIKNPLGIINATAYSLARCLPAGNSESEQQIEIIREEVERADRIITELIGYAQLAEGKVERLHIAEELDAAIDQVFPTGSSFQVALQKSYSPALPSVLMQRNHLSEVLVNILQNAREALNGDGKIEVTARSGENYSVVVTIADNGPGVPPDKVERVFEPYYTSKAKGTGLGLAIVKHNLEIYGGTVRIESGLGKGARFVLQLPGKSLMRLRK